MSSDISLNTLYDTDSIRSMDDKTEVSLSDLSQKEQEIVEKTQELARNIPPLSPNEEREISFEAQPLGKEPPLSDEEFSEGMEKLTHAMQEAYKPQNANYLTKFRDLVIRIIEQLGRSADEKDRAQMDELKKNYRKATKKEAELIQKIGNMGFVFSTIALGCMFGQFLPFFNKADKGIMQFLSEHSVPPLGKMFTGRKESEQREMNALSQLLLTEHSAITSKTQSESGSKQEISQLSQSLQEVLRAATRGG